jgi:hypothetical protein
VLSSPLDGTSVQPPAVTVNQDTAGAPQNETAIAIDPNNPQRIVAGANDYVTRTWTCTIAGTPCSALGDGYSGTYFSNDGGKTWCCTATDPSHLGTLIPGVERLTGGQYDAGGDPAVPSTAEERLLRGPGLQPDERTEHGNRQPRHVRQQWGAELVSADVHQPNDITVDSQRQGMDRGRSQSD